MDASGEVGPSSENIGDSSGEPERGDKQRAGRSCRAIRSAVDIAELSRRALCAEMDLLAYVDELENEVRRLRRRLDVDAERYEEAEGVD